MTKEYIAVETEYFGSDKVPAEVEYYVRFPIKGEPEWKPQTRSNQRLVRITVEDLND